MMGQYSQAWRGFRDTNWYAIGGTNKERKKVDGARVQEEGTDKLESDKWNHIRK